MKQSFVLFAYSNINPYFCEQNQDNMQGVQFNDAQLHVLNMASHIKTEQSLNQLKQQLASFYAKLIDEQMDELWDAGEWNQEKLDSLRGAHFRTHY